MTCLIDNIIKWGMRKGVEARVLRRYLRIRYRMNIDLTSLEKRLEFAKSDEIEIA